MQLELTFFHSNMINKEIFIGDIQKASLLSTSSKNKPQLKGTVQRDGSSRN
jgi:hypothetical protein